jgi:Leucyl aminopeptidase (aminopeptidase T)
VASVPTAAWAKAVFPDKDEEEAIACLWDEIFKACRVGGDAVADWKAHSDEVQKHVQILNELNLKTLRYKNSAGTDVTVELPEGHFWAGGEEAAADGTIFSANIPTEEVFTLPKKDSINGTIVATKPLCHNGTVIEGIRFVVKDGKIVEAHSDTGEDVLKDAIKVDEGASYFGEVALVPYDSPISNSGVLFLNTLYDENASCHFAFGEAYPLIKDADKMSKEELKERGVNFSMTHVDFMVGSADLEIIGTTHDGREVEIFRDGNFAI